MLVHSRLNIKYFFPLIAGLALVSLLFMPLTAANLWWREAFNSGHTILFIFISFTLYFWLKAVLRFSTPMTIYLLVLVAGMLFGVVIEVLQGLMQREASVDDLYRNLSGIISGLGLVSVTRQKVLRNKILMALFSLGFLLLGTASLLQLSWHYVQRDRAFPLIADFGEEWSSSFVRFNNTKLLGPSVRVSDENNRSFRLRFEPGKYPGVSVIEPEKNWLVYNRLRFEVFSDNAEDVILVLRVHDKSHNQNYNDRFNQTVIIRPGLNDVAVNLSELRKAPVDRELDLTEIAGIKLFLIEVKTILFLEVGNVFLEK